MDEREKYIYNVVLLDKLIELFNICKDLSIVDTLAPKDLIFYEGAMGILMNFTEDKLIEKRTLATILAAMLKINQELTERGYAVRYKRNEGEIITFTAKIIPKG